ncbi:hypothetical protein GCM10010145_48140 [Streptomyces ruber]|uniref:Uncharacterized protein n=2 Tax=Streptomyces TaxID=1883 RepID=A0A918EU38_9ACTN|nr:hypothetical protein [Streptomyces ruber]GGQ72809.1 hypothetical protein GCM10010145_48140 [Streptomyces ruber]
MARHIEVPVDDAAYEVLEEEAARAGITVPELVGQVLAHDLDMRRFLAAAAHFAAAWGPAFDAEFGPAHLGAAA